MAQPKVTILGSLHPSNETNRELVLDIVVGKGYSARSVLLDVSEEIFRDKRPDLYGPPEQPVVRDMPRYANRLTRQKIRDENEAAQAKWRHDCEDYKKALREKLEYREAIADFLRLQQAEPQFVGELGFWVYRCRVLRVDPSATARPLGDLSDDVLIKHFVLRQERHYERIRREVEALENLDKLENVSREPIPEPVRLFVWQRDQGRCVKCGSRERLEFDHIIPVAAGGSNTERNIQILCEACNRSKGATI